MKQNSTLIQVKDVLKDFQVGLQTIKVLKGINFEINEAEFLVIFGPSGCGKSTLLHTILGLEDPSKGKIDFLGNDLYQLSETERNQLRKEKIGMVYQQPNWIRSLNVKENVAFPLILLNRTEDEANQKALQILDKFDMSAWASFVPTELSSGQQQRVALSRALINDPKIIVADEPTGNLDYDSGIKLIKHLASLNRDEHKTIIMVTHDLEYLPYATRALEMLDGNIVNNYSNKQIQKLVKNLKGKRGVSKKTINQNIAKHKGKTLDSKALEKLEDESQLSGEKNLGLKTKQTDK